MSSRDDTTRDVMSHKAPSTLDVISHTNTYFGFHTIALALAFVTTAGAPV